MLPDLKKDFPIFAHHPGLVYLDSTSTTQKPRYVIEGMKTFMETGYANIHRGAYRLSEISEELYDASKERVRTLINARDTSEIQYTYNATYAANMLAGSLRRSGRLRTGDTVLLCVAEHHANVVPWHILREDIGINIEYVALRDDYTIDLDDLRAKYTPNVKVVSFTVVSNVTGAVTDLTPVRSIIGDETLFVVDATQAVPHRTFDVQAIGCDACFFTGHKMYSDTGIGVLYGRRDLMRALAPALGGGGAINWVREDAYMPAGLPYRYEPGTPHIIGAVSLLRAIEYIESIGGYATIMDRERTLMERMLRGFAEMGDDVRLIGSTDIMHRAGVFSFELPRVHATDVAEFLAHRDICVRSGLHCAEPLLGSLGLGPTVRASFGAYSDESDVDHFFEGLRACLVDLG